MAVQACHWDGVEEVLLLSETPLKDVARLVKRAVSGRADPENLPEANRVHDQSEQGRRQSVKMAIREWGVWDESLVLRSA